MLPPVLNAGGGGGAVFHQQNGEGDFILSFIHIFALTGAHLLSYRIRIQVKNTLHLNFKKDKIKYLKINYFSCNFSICFS